MYLKELKVSLNSWSGNYSLNLNLKNKIKVKNLYNRVLNVNVYLSLNIEDF